MASRNQRHRRDGTPEKETPMLAEFEFKFDQHETTIRRAEANYALISASATKKTDTSQLPPRGKLTGLLRRLTGPATA
jgi:hypothetical protein